MVCFMLAPGRTPLTMESTGCHGLPREVPREPPSPGSMLGTVPGFETIWVLLDDFES
jgi:hypothetical protein